MNIGVIGSGSIGPDLAYGFISSVARSGGRVYLVDIRQEALDQGMARIGGYVKKGVARGKLSKKAAQAVEVGLIPTLDLNDLKDCDYVIEAATEDLKTKQAILAQLEAVVRPDCLIGFATSGIPRARIAATVKHPERCFVNHPFFPAWRSPPVEVVLSGDETYDKRMLDTLVHLGKVPIITADAPCFAADDIFVNYCAEAARIVAEGLATPAQVDKIVDSAIGGGGPFRVMDLTKGNLLNVHCMELMRDADTGSEWFEPPPIFTEQGNTSWFEREGANYADYDDALAKTVLDRILAVLMGRTLFVVDHEICAPGALNWLTRMALGFGEGLLDVAEELGAERVHGLCTKYADSNPGFELTPSVTDMELPSFHRDVVVEREGGIATVTVCRPEVRNALSGRALEELELIFEELDTDDSVRGVVLTGFNGSLAGADLGELAVLETPEDAEFICHRGQRVFDVIAGLSKPVVAALNGPVLGGGAELSMACHARVVGKGLMWGQPEVNLGIIPGYGGTQRLPRLIGIEKAFDLIRTGRAVGAKEAIEWGWATGEPAADVVAAAVELIGKHLEGSVTLGPVDPKPMDLPDELPKVDIGHHSLAIDAIVVGVLSEGLRKPLEDGLDVEAKGFARCKKTVDIDIGITNFLQNGPRVPAAFLHE